MLLSLSLDHLVQQPVCILQSEHVGLAVCSGALVRLCVRKKDGGVRKASYARLERISEWGRVKRQKAEGSV